MVAKGLMDRYASGTWKDISGRGLLLSEAEIEIDYVEFDPADLASAVSKIADDSRTVIVEYSVYPELLLLIRNQDPGRKLLVRAINAEAFQHLHRTNPGFLPSYGNLRNWYGIARLAWRDRRSAKISDAVIGISEWDRTHYWAKLCSSKKLFDLPYFCPWVDLRPNVERRNWSDREDLIVCLPGGGDRLSAEQRSNLALVAKELQSNKNTNHIRCGLTGGFFGDDDQLSRVERLGRVDEPWDLLCRVKAVAVLTQLGFGLKTTVVDALAAGCRVLVHHKLIHRLPTWSHEYLTPIDPKAVDAEGILETLTREPDDWSVLHDRVKLQAATCLGQTIECS